MSTDDAPADGAPPPPRVHFDTSALKSSYCNVCNGSSTREEVVINFGVNEGWDLGQSDVAVKLHHRVVMSPFAAKRLSEMLTKLLRDHEARYGELK